jgi:hypothetical protein
LQCAILLAVKSQVGLIIVNGINMESISIAQLESQLIKAGIVIAVNNRQSGRELSYKNAPLRTIVIHIGDSNNTEYVIKIILSILEIEDDWFLIPRYGMASDLGLIENYNFMAIHFLTSDRQKLIEYLSTRSMDIGGFSCDLYVVSKNGSILITWDHHTAAEGLTVDMCNVAQSTQLLGALNDIGAELEIYYKNR